MIRFVAVRYRIADGFKPCPYCGGSPELLQIEGEDFILRCSDCHASTQKARMGHEEAIADWNAGEIIDDHYAITMDKKIDEYLRKGVKGLWMSEYSMWEPFPVIDNDHLFTWLYVFSEDIVLLVDNSHEFLQYEEIREFNPYKDDPDTEQIMSLAYKEEPIQFLQSEWSGDNLLSLTFQCGNRKLLIFSNVAEQCLVAREF